MKKQPLFTTKDVMRILSISQRTLYYWIEQGKLHPVRIGRGYRFKPEEIEALINESKVEVGTEKKQRVLAIDDDLLVRESLKLLLERSGLEAIVVKSGKEALEVLKEASFDVIITDMRMPEMSGVQTIEAIRALRDQQGKPDIPVVVITGYQDQQARDRAIKLGVKKFIMKPFEWDEFLGVLTSL